MNTRTVRIVQIGVLAAISLFASFVFIGNLLDYNSNYQFVKHVLAMDTTFEGNALMWRAITSDMIVNLAYWSIIVVEGLVAVLGWMGVYKLTKSIKATSEVFNQNKAVGYYAFLLAIALWFVGFIVIGSEWFAMWQSGTWNGKQTAMDIVEVVGIFLIIYMLPIQDILAPKKK